jgi:glycosyltransferase involved in cell wall biosynthesis
MDVVLPISCFIIAKNEADRIARTIQSVRSWVDEVVVVDSESSDNTVAVARQEGARVVTQPWLGFGGQKRFAEDQCRNDWLFNIDADEVVTRELQLEIAGLFEPGLPSFVAYGMPIHLIYPGNVRPRVWARDHWYVRLYDRRLVRFRDSAIHDSVVTNDHRIGALRASVHHHSMRSFEDMKRKLDERAWLSVKYADPHSTAPLLPRLITEIPMNFFKYYIGRVHFTGGITGLRYAAIQSWYRYLKIYRMQRARGSWPRFFFGWQREHEAAKARDGLSPSDTKAAGILEDQVQVDLIPCLPSVHPLDAALPDENFGLVGNLLGQPSGLKIQPKL